VFSNSGAVVAPAGKTSYAGPDNGTGFDYSYLSMISLDLADLEGTTLTEPMVFDVVLTGTSSSDVTAGLTGETFPVTQRIVINPSIGAFVGTYTVFEQFTGGAYTGSGFAGIFGENYEVELTLIESDTTASTMLVTNSGLNTYYPEGTVLIFSLGGTLTIDDGANLGIPLLVEFNYHLIDTTSYDYTTAVIMASGNFINGSGASYGAYETVLTKQ
jgi:hypothetical protein